MDESIIIRIIWGVHAVLAVLAIIDLFYNPRFGGGFRIMMIVVIAAFPIVGPLMYLVLRTAAPK